VRGSKAARDVSFFVKNVENVQGDERDYIIFSSTFGRNAQGSFRRNFGVLGQKGGERRLNVAVTRAKTKVIMVTSMPIAEISDMLASRRPPSVPRDYLQGYLEYARAMSDGELQSGRTLLARLTVGRSELRNKDATEDDGFTSAVAAYLAQLGVKAQVTNDGSAFGVDFAVEDPATGLFGIGIECDAPPPSNTEVG
jgi:primosomal replication protein N''